MSASKKRRRLFDFWLRVSRWNPWAVRRVVEHSNMSEEQKRAFDDAFKKMDEAFKDLDRALRQEKRS